MADGNMADDKMPSSDSAFDDGVPTPTASRFFELNVFSDPIVKPGNRCELIPFVKYLER